MAHHRTKAIPYSVRRACLRMVSDGVPQQQITRRHGISMSTLAGWIRVSRVLSGSRLSEEELDSHLEMWAGKFRDLELPEDASPMAKRLKKQGDRSKFGASKEEKEAHALSMLKDLGDPEAYHSALTEHFAEVASRFDRETSIQGQMTAMWAGYLLVQMRGIIDNPLPITSVGDVEKIFNMFRKTFNMDSTKGGADEGPQLAFLNESGRRGKVIEVGHKKRGNSRKPPREDD